MIRCIFRQVSNLDFLSEELKSGIFIFYNFLLTIDEERLSLKYKSVIKKYFHQFFNDGEIYLFDKKIKFLSRIKVVFNTDETRLKFFRNLGFNLG